MEILKRITKDHVFAILLLLLLICFGSSIIDPDFGYRLKNGEFVIKRGLEFFKMTDPYSYTMPSYRIIDHSWGTAILIYLIYSRAGMLGLSVLWSFVALISLYIAVKSTESGYQKKIPSGYFLNFVSIFVLTSLVFIFAVRVQVLSWFFLTLFLYLYFKRRIWNKFRYLVPLLFLVWVNLHGSFIAGIVTFALLLGIESLNLKFPRKLSFKEFERIISNLKLELNKIDLIIFTLSVFATFLNPYGIEIWRKTSSVALTGQLRWEIEEWKPTPLKMGIADGLYLVTSLFFVIRQRSKLKSNRLYLYFAYLLQGLLASRHFQIFLFVSLPITLDAISFFNEEVVKIKNASERLNKFMRFLMTLSLVSFVAILFVGGGGGLRSSERNFYPDKAIDFIKNKKPEGQIFALYRWGGYLNWKLPEKKVFVNGFMPLWENKEASDGESTNAYSEYTKVLKGELDYKDVFDKYNISHVLLNAAGKPRNIDKLSGKFMGLLENKYGKIERVTLAERLHRGGWKVVYEDEIAIIYEKP